MNILPTGWRRLPFDECVIESPIKRRPSIPQNAYKSVGSFPIVDQGARFVAGYTDDANSVYREPLPLIVFGDHTRVLKYLDFPFATGADGTKILFPNRKTVDPGYFFYALRALNIEGRGYNRHYSFLREHTILAPEAISEQNAIASVLSKIQAAVKTQDETITKLKELKTTTLIEIFRRGLNGRSRKQKKTEIATIPENWTVARLDTLADLLSGGTPSKARPEWWLGTMPWASPKDMKRPRLWDTQDHITEEAVENGSRAVPAKTIFIVIRGMILAKDVPIAITETPMAFNQDMKAIISKSSVDADFLFYAIDAHKGALSKAIGTSAHGTRCIGSASLERLLLPVPTKLAEQRTIAASLRKIEDAHETASKKRNGLRTLFSSVLHKLMTGQTRV